MSIDKKKLLSAYADLLKADLEVLIQSAKVAHEAATHVESKAEDQYDTRGLEASYLADAQSRRSSELEANLHTFQTIEPRSFNKKDAIRATALITLDCDGKESTYFFMPCGGGLSTLLDGKRILVITPQSPLGEALLGKKVGDQVSVMIQKQMRDYDILRVE